MQISSELRSLAGVFRARNPDVFDFESAYEGLIELLDRNKWDEKLAIIEVKVFGHQFTSEETDIINELIDNKVKGLPSPKLSDSEKAMKILAVAKATKESRIPQHPFEESIEIWGESLSIET